MTGRDENPSTMFGGWRSRLSHIVARIVPVDVAWYRGRPLVSFTFDDFPASAASTAATILEHYGACGSFYAATGLIGQAHDLWEMAPRSALAQLEARGHEIGLHTHEHRIAWQYGHEAFQKDLSLNDSLIRSAAKGYVPETFAYPYGIGNWAHKRALSRRVRAARSTHPGINCGLIDLHFLKAHELIDCAMTPERVDELLDCTIAAGGWLIFVSHDVCDEPTPYGVSPHLLHRTVRMAREKGIDVLPVCEALDVLGVALDKTPIRRVLGPP